MRHMRFQKKLFLTYVIISSFILLLFALFFYHYISQQLISDELGSLSILNDSFARQADASIEDLDSTSANINYSSLMRGKLDASYQLDLSESKLRGLADLFVTINGTDIKADQINIYDLSGHVAHVGMVTSSGTISTNSLPWFKTVQELGGRKMISTPYSTDIYSKSVRYSEWFISLYRTYSNQFSAKVGAIETVKRCSSVFKSIISYQKKNKGNAASTYIFTSGGKLVYPYDISDQEKANASIYFTVYGRQKNQTADVCSFYNKEKSTREHFAYNYSSYTGWVYISSQPESVILKPVNHLVGLLLLFVCILLFIALIYSYQCSKRLVKPINHLKHIIQRMDIENLGGNETENYNTEYSELDELYFAFRNMSNTLKISMNDLLESRQQEFKATNLALQSQANPHFYFNTLSSIIVLSENHQDDDVISLCRSLTRIMRYITDSSNTVVSIQQELDYVKQYLYCMKVRYQSSLSYSITIDEALYSIRIPKLIIQPLVENAIKYGTDCTPPWTISIHGWQDKEHWQVDVIDSGNGFSDKVLDAIQKNIAHAKERSGMPELHINGLGIVNVFLRWKFYVGDGMIFHIGNTPEGHGICSIGAKLTGEELCNTVSL
jgi:two-component system sensor histidine kinase YesM